MNEPNHICKNNNCKREYYACDDCDSAVNLNWRSVACSTECFKEYMKPIEGRDNPKVIVKEEIKNTKIVK